MAEERPAQPAGRVRTVAVYCGASSGKNPTFKEKAAELGAYLAEKQIAVVYGGSNFGLLGVMASAAADKGGKVTGILPRFFTEMADYQAVGEEIIVRDMHTRKKMMFDKVDAFIALPGGVGTMEELTEILTWSKLSLHCKPVGLLNPDGYYDHFLQWLTRGMADGFIDDTGGEGVSGLMVISSEPKPLVDLLCQRCIEKNSPELLAATIAPAF